VGLAREMVGAYFFGANAIWAAWKVAFTIPNLFRKLFGEGALSAAFIPLYAQAIKREQAGRTGGASPAGPAQSSTPEAADFASASVNLLVSILFALTIVSEGVLLALVWFAPLRPDHLLTVKLAMIMLPYVLLVCGAAFLSAILQVHNRFAAAAATSIVLNVCLIAAMILAAGMFDLTTEAGQTSAVRWLSWSVLVSGAMQVVMLLPSLRAAGFRFRLFINIWTPSVRRMLALTGPVAMGAAVLQIGVLMDKGLAIMLARAPGATKMAPFGHSIDLPMVEGAAARLDLAQFMYQFPLGVFAIALATAIFPKLAGEASGDIHRVAASDSFRSVLRRGVESAMFIGLPASAGMALVALPAARLLFQHGQFTASDAEWVALSTAIYACAIWAFSLLQIVNRAYYALHDAATPLKWVAINLLLNLIIELPLVFTSLGESGMAVGTLVSFTIQSLAMLWILNRRTGGIGLGLIAPNILKMLIATIVMTGACLAVMASPIYSGSESKLSWALQLATLTAVGGGVYFATCKLLGIDVLQSIRKRR